MEEVHGTLAVAVVVVALVAAAAGFLAYRRGRAGHLSAHLLTLVQTLLVAQVGLGLLLLSDKKRAPEQLHYLYGTLALVAVLAPWMYAPATPRRRLLWFAGATLVAGALATRAWMTGRA